MLQGMWEREVVSSRNYTDYSLVPACHPLARKLQLLFLGAHMAQAETKKVLVVEDNATLAAMVKFVLELEGFEVLVAYDAENAVELFSAEKPHVVISDIMLPGIDGFTLIGMLKKLSDVPVIIITALVGIEHKRRGLAAGAADYITKPFEPNDLVLRVKAVLQ